MFGNKGQEPNFSRPEMAQLNQLGEEMKKATIRKVAAGMQFEATKMAFEAIALRDAGTGVALSAQADKVHEALTELLDASAGILALTAKGSDMIKPFDLK